MKSPLLVAISCAVEFAYKTTSVRCSRIANSELDMFCEYLFISDGGGVIVTICIYDKLYYFNELRFANQSFAIRESRIANDCVILKSAELNRTQLMLKPQDIVILLKIISTMALRKDYPDIPMSQNTLATYLCMSASEVNAGVKRLVLSELLGLVNRDGKMVFLPIKPACEECLISGVKYFFPVELGAYTRGIATSYAAPLFEKLLFVGNDPIPVWPYAEGDQRGVALMPLYRSVPDSIAQHPDQDFYELLVLVDAIRSGRARERNLASKLLREKIKNES